MTTHPEPHDIPTRSRRRSWRLLAVVLVAAVAVALGADAAMSAGRTSDSTSHSHGSATMRPADRAAAMRATAGFQDVETAEAAGYASTMDTLGCFQNSEAGGMGLHYLNADLMDGEVDITEPEAMVYELDADGTPVAVVAHEYIVPVDAWSSARPPRLFGVDFHRHPTLPLWVLHAWLWKDNPTGMFQDWNPAVRLCPAGVPIFGRDLPKPAGG